MSVEFIIPTTYSMFSRLRVTFSCMMDLSKFPLDRQKCTMEVASCELTYFSRRFFFARVTFYLAVIYVIPFLSSGYTIFPSHSSCSSVISSSAMIPSFILRGFFSVFFLTQVPVVFFLFSLSFSCRIFSSFPTTTTATLPCVMRSNNVFSIEPLFLYAHPLDSLTCFLTLFSTVVA